MVLSLLGSLWAEQYRSSDSRTVHLAALPTSITGWEGRDEPVNEGVADMLKCDQLIHRVYVSRIGQEIELYVLFWATPASTAHMHHPDVCMPCQGWEIESSDVRPVTYRHDRLPIPVSVRTYSQKNQRQMVFYWTQSGAVYLPDGKEDLSQFSEYAWVRQMLTGNANLERTSRLSVRIDMEAIGNPEHQEEVMSEIGAAIAREVYALCPWAMPAK
jgi:EpsI family protein